MWEVGKKMSRREQAVMLGLHPNFFASMKCSCPVKYKYIENLSPNLAEAYRKYMQEQEDYKTQLTEMYYALSDRKKVMAFSIHLQAIGMYSNWNGFSTTINYTLFKSGEGLGNHRFFIKAPKILAEYHKVKDML